MRHSSSIPVEYCAKCSHIVENKYRLKYTPFAIRFKLHGYVLEITTGFLLQQNNCKKKKTTHDSQNKGKHFENDSGSKSYEM